MDLKPGIYPTDHGTLCYVAGENRPAFDIDTQQQIPAWQVQPHRLRAARPSDFSAPTPQQSINVSRHLERGCAFCRLDSDRIV